MEKYSNAIMQMVLVHQMGDTISNRVLQIYQEF